MLNWQALIQFWTLNFANLSAKRMRGKLQSSLAAWVRPTQMNLNHSHDYVRHTSI